MTLPKESILDESCVENIVCKKMHTLQRHPMSKDDSELFAILSLSSPIELDGKNKNEFPFLVMLVLSRLDKYFTMKLESSVTLMIAQIAKNPALAILYLAYMQYRCKIENIHNVDFTTFCKMFPDGFFSDEDLFGIWESQKVEGTSLSDNLLDYPNAYKSIQLSYYE